MTQQPINVVRMIIGAARALDDQRRAAEAAWKRLTGSDKDTSTGDRHQPPQIW